ncbi:MAG: MaoC family dehydratase [Saprospiraceae bacterium]|mgnify:FL=1|nr:MaoC family dehydratase [Saprospiraceae bacterium]MBK7698661.1 MaoC family dehydratase [Saprospiraceae bacterium]MBK9743926.1 MaoC family dehydratase [Saprospiraceae bacterium]MBP9056305.1 MaoC family dehydratase [Saprospiraceae bacterium]
MDLSEFKVGSEFSYSFSFSQDDVLTFANASGDFNPIHLDDEFAKTTIFKKKIVHGFLGGSVFSKVFGTLFPGSGTIYIKQSMTFYKPMFVDQGYVAKFKVIEIDSIKNKALVSTEIYDNENCLIIGGEALIKYPIIV